MDDLPFELLVKILSYLPWHSQLRRASMSRSARSLPLLTLPVRCCPRWRQAGQEILDRQARTYASRFLQGDLHVKYLGETPTQYSRICELLPGGLLYFGGMTGSGYSNDLHFFSFCEESWRLVATQGQRPL
jgi:hypothetical protein